MPQLPTRASGDTAGPEEMDRADPGGDDTRGAQQPRKDQIAGYQGSGLLVELHVTDTHPSGGEKVREIFRHSLGQRRNQYALATPRWAEGFLELAAQHAVERAGSAVAWA